MDFKKTVLLVSTIFMVLLLFASAFAMSEEERQFLLMYFKEEELQVVSTTRSLKSISRVAENVEVVTKEDIELMNAHTLADVLDTVNGVVVDFHGASPGSQAAASIQGSAAEHVVLLVDGVTLNELTSDIAIISDIPVQMIEKIEIIKGPASSVWGSSLGGIINVITKAPSAGKLNGVVSASYGERTTADLRAELSGSRSGLGYYFTAGRLQTDGLRSHEELNVNDLYLKGSYEFSNSALAFSLFYSKTEREDGDFTLFDFLRKSRPENLFGTISLRGTLSPDMDFEVSMRAQRQTTHFDYTFLSEGDMISSKTVDKKYGASAKVSWKTGIHNVVVGSDYDYKKNESTDFMGTVPKLNTYAAYVNDSIVLGGLTVTPGIRFDHTDRSADFTSPAIGVTYELTGKTLARGDVARGFHLPNIGSTLADSPFYRHNPDLKPEKVWSYQAGIESWELGFVWVKLSAFIHEIKDAIVYQDIDVDEGTWTVVNKDKVRRKGFGAALKTRKFYNLVFSTAATFVKSRNLTTDQDIHDFPDYTYDLGLIYDDGKSFKALMKGRYAWWHNDPFLNGKYDAFLFDLNLTKVVYSRSGQVCEVFATGHNIFDARQYPDEVFKNAGRWVEAGLRYKF